MTYKSLKKLNDLHIITLMEIEELNQYVIDIHNRISNNVKHFRQKRGVSQLQLALDIGMTGNAFLARAEKQTDNAHFNIEHIAKIAQVLEVDIRDFFVEV